MVDYFTLKWKAQFFLKGWERQIVVLGDINNLEGNRKMLERESVQSMLNSLFSLHGTRAFKYW